MEDGFCSVIFSKLAIVDDELSAVGKSICNRQTL